MCALDADDPADGASEGPIRGNVDSVMKVIAALDNPGIAPIGDYESGVSGDRGIRLKK